MLSLDAGTYSNIHLLFTVPNGKRLVVEDVSGVGLLPTGQKLLIAELLFSDNASAIEAPITFSGAQGGAADFFQFGRVARAYVNAGVNVSVTSVRSDNTGAASVFFTLSGYLADLP
jgi:hypothetical protein